MKIFNNIQYLEEVDSTNNYLKINSPLENIIVYTFNQTKGKGRNNKIWFDKKNKSLAISFYFKPDKNILHIFYYIATISLSYINVLQKLKIKNSWIKWPNDIYVGKKKLAGILTENTYIKNVLNGLIIGIGININHTKKELSKIDTSATSLYNEKSNEFNLSEIFNSLLIEFEKMFSILFNYEFNFIFEMWKKRSNIKSKKIKTIIDNEEILCNILDVNEDGSLIVFHNQKKLNVYTGKIII
jgi:BirA family transcriptional regulator, biotin operon repressor / biotin---[acetyl-CoA-carboxylase] ligase